MAVSTEYPDLRSFHGGLQQEVAAAHELVNNFNVYAKNDINKLDEDISKHIKSIRYFSNAIPPPLKTMGDILIRKGISNSVEEYVLLVDRLVSQLKIFKTTPVNHALEPTSHAENVPRETSKKSSKSRQSRSSKQEKAPTPPQTPKYVIIHSESMPSINKNSPSSSVKSNNPDEDNEWFEIENPLSESQN